MLLENLGALGRAAYCDLLYPLGFHRQVAMSSIVQGRGCAQNIYLAGCSPEANNVHGGTFNKLIFRQ